MIRGEQCGGRAVYGLLTKLALIVLLAGTLPHAARATCLGDCNGDCQVTVNEIVTLVNIALGTQPLGACLAALGPTPVVQIDVIISVIDNALHGCPSGDCCGNGQVDAGDECDDGGICVGGPNAGTPCTVQSQCSGNGVCDAGEALGHVCATGDDCPDGHCVHCKTFGGDGCAANCTLEKDIDLPLVSGVLNEASADLLAGTSGAVIHGDILTVPLPVSGSEKLTVGSRSADGTVPFVIKAANFVFPKITVPTLGEVCVRAVPLQTCGGSLFEADGSESPSCGLGFIETNCPSDRPCVSVYGPGNSGAGVLGCGEGLAGIDVGVAQDAGGQSGQAGPILRTVQGSGPQGSARLLSSVSITSHVGTDPTFCVDDQPLIPFGQVATTLLTTGSACCEIHNLNGRDGTSLGPFCVSGTPLNCGALNGEALHGGLAGTFPLLAQTTVQDVCVTTQFFAKARISPPAATALR